MGSTSKTFVREATGLVREISWLDAFNFNVIGMGGITALFFDGMCVALIGGSPLLAVLIGAVMGVCILFTYYMLTVSMPRSGGDYVFVSRILHPSLGLINACTNIFLGIFFVGTFASFPWMGGALSPFLSYVGTAYNNPTLVQWSNALLDPILGVAVGLIVIVFFVLLLIMKPRWVHRYITISIMWPTVMVVFIGVLFLSTSHGNFIKLFDSYAGAYGTSAADIIATAKGAGWRLPESNLFNSFLSGAVFAQSWMWGAYGTSFGGEIKTPRRSQLYGMIGCVIFWSFFTSLAFVPMVNMTGFDLFSAGFYLSIYQPALWKLPVLPYFTMYANFLAGNPYVAGLMTLSVIPLLMGAVPWGLIVSTKYLFAMSFDRMAPSWLADVSDKYHSPAKAAIVCGILGIIVCLIFLLPTAGTLVFWLTGGFSLTGMILLFIGSLAAIAFPYRRKSLFSTASPFKAKIAGISVVSVVGGLSAVSLLFEIFTFLVFPNLTGLIPLTISIQFAIMAVSFALYFVIKYYRKSRGVDITAVFREIPPE